MGSNRRSTTGGLAGVIVLIGLVLAFAFGDFNLPIFFIALAFASLIGSVSSGNPQGIYGGIQGFFWLIMLALFFITGSWIWFLVGAVLSAILGTQARAIMLRLGALSFFGTQQRPQQPYYQPPQQAYQPPPQPHPTYQEGYRPPPQQPETYQEGGQQYPYSSPTTQQYEQPQAQYPQQMPPQQ